LILDSLLTYFFQKIPTFPNIFFLVFPLFCAGEKNRNKAGGFTYFDENCDFGKIYEFLTVFCELQSTFTDSGTP